MNWSMRRRRAGSKPAGATAAAERAWAGSDAGASRARASPAIRSLFILSFPLGRRAVVIPSRARAKRGPARDLGIPTQHRGVEERHETLEPHQSLEESHATPDPSPGPREVSLGASSSREGDEQHSIQE